MTDIKQLREATIQFDEKNISKNPALQLLKNLGWEYLLPEKALALRGGKTSNVLLDDVLIEWLQANNKFNYKGEGYSFSENNISSAVRALKEIPFDGLVRTNEKIYELLCFGKSFQEKIAGNRRSFTLNYIDWLHPENNVYHVTEEFSVKRAAGSFKSYVPDIVLFVNGIPLAIIECKSPNIKEPIKQAVSQHIRNQKDDGIPLLFKYSQILLAVSKNEAKYATTGTAEKFWSIWREEIEGYEKELQRLVTQPLTDEQVDQTYKQMQIRDQLAPVYENGAQCIQRKVTEQDRLVFALCRRERFLELIYHFILFDNGEKKIARYPQYFCVKKLMARICLRDQAGRRCGGVVWHTQGSGKSLMMVMLAKMIAFSSDISQERIVLVTDRHNLDDQIYAAFKHCGKELVQATTGKHLAELLRENKGRIITTLVHKFKAAVGRHAVKNMDDNIFVLADEVHRTHYNIYHANMRLVLPNACYIGFTGTPVMKKNKNTVEQFGGMIDTYSMTRAVKDKVVVPLLYEGRHVAQYVDKHGIDAWFERITEKLSDAQKADLKRKFSTPSQINKAEQTIKAIAWDISEHFHENWQGTGFKAQLAVPCKDAALLYKKYLDEFGEVTSEVLISPPDKREGEENIYAKNKQSIHQFWNAMMKQYGSEQKYNDGIINRFKFSESPEIIIVVDKLLTGFDAPCNTVLYLARRLKDHTLLQAMARVNRLYDGKEYGYVLDYLGVLENINHTLDVYKKLEEFQQKDLINVLTDITKEIDTLPQKHSVLWGTFNTIRNRFDEEEYEQILASDALRHKFYERLSNYARTMAIAFSNVDFYERTPAGKIEQYRCDLKFFSKLRISVRRRYAESIDFAEYEGKIQKLLDTHVGAGEVEKITPLINVFNQEAFKEELEKLSSDAAKADTIAHRTKRTIEMRKSEDPVFYERFSKLIDRAIKDFRSGRIKDSEYLNKVNNASDCVINRTGDDIPDKLEHYGSAKAYFGCLKKILCQTGEVSFIPSDEIAETALQIHDVIEQHRIVDWIDNNDVKKRMGLNMDDILYAIQDKFNLIFSGEDHEKLVKQCLDIAETRRT